MKLEQLTISKDKTTIIDGKGDEDTINKRIEELAHQVEGSKVNLNVNNYKSRLAKMCGGVSIIHVGGEMKLK